MLNAVVKLIIWAGLIIGIIAISWCLISLVTWVEMKWGKHKAKGRD